MEQPQSLSQKDPAFPKRTASNCTEVDNDDDAVWIGLAALSTYLGFSFEQTMNHTLNPVIKRLVGELRTSLQDQ